MKKIPTLFVRVFENHKIVDITDEITPGCELAFKEGRATIKYDGSCCAMIDGHFYKRYDCKKGKTPPEGAIPCCDPDPVTGHWPHWVKVSKDEPGDKWFNEALKNTVFDIYNVNGTYEAVGPHFQGNPYGLTKDMLVKHGEIAVVDLDRTFEGIREFLEYNDCEGLVFWYDDEPVCKIKRSDFGYPWPEKEAI